MALQQDKHLFEGFGFFASLVVVAGACFFVRFNLESDIIKTVLTKHYSYFVDKMPPLKVFMYNLSLPLQDQISALQYIKAISLGVAHTTVFEYIAYNSIARYRYKVDDPENADLYYVPLFGAIFNGRKKDADIDDVIIPKLRDFGQYFDKYDGVDHAFMQMLFSQDNIPITIQKQMSLASMITLGDLDFNYSKNNVRESWRNINFPLTSNIQQYYDIERKRKISAFFIGQIELSGFDEVAAPIRRGMATQMREIPHSIVIDAKRYDPVHCVYNYNFSRMMMNSEFCCVPHGDGPTTKRLFDTFRTLCIPVVLSDEIRFPFEELFIDYSAILLQIPAFRPDQISIAMSLPSKQKKNEIRKNMIQISKLLEQRFDYRIENGDLMWGWLWVHYFKLATVAASKRRGLLQSVFI